MKCCICGKPIDKQYTPDGLVFAYGNNASPVKDGRCCANCNATVVIPARLKQLISKEE